MLIVITEASVLDQLDVVMANVVGPNLSDNRHERIWHVDCVIFDDDVVAVMVDGRCHDPTVKMIIVVSPGLHEWYAV